MKLLIFRGLTFYLDISSTPTSSPKPETVEFVQKHREENKQIQQAENLSPTLSEESTLQPSAPPAFLPDTNSILQVLAKFTKNEPNNEGQENTEVTENPSSSLDTSESASNPSATDSRPESSESTTQDSTSAAIPSVNSNPDSSNNLIMQLFQQGQQTSQVNGLESIPTGPSSSTNLTADSNSIPGDPRANRRRSRSPDADSSGLNKRQKTDGDADVHDAALKDNSQEPGQQEHIVRPRNVIRDPTIRDGSIKVLSRTLFIGGVPHNTSEKDLSDQLNQFGRVQSVVIHKEGKHAFVKLYSRQEAEVTKDRCEEERSAGRLSLRARWGVGFGPRECCEYETGISIIPLSKLTEADKRWTVEAEYGGTGGLPLESGLCIEEPDIEIGAGVSSKAISQRMPSNSSRNGPKSSRAERAERDRPSRGPDNGRPFGKNGNRFGASSGPGRGGHGEDRRGRFDRSKRSGRGGRNDNGPGRFGDGPHRDMRGLHNRNGHVRGNDRGNGMMGGPQGPMMGYGNIPGGNMGYSMPQMNDMGGMNNMNTLGAIAGGNNLPANLASLLSTLTQQNNGMPDGMGGPNNNGQHNNGGHGGKRFRNRNNYGHNGHNNNGYGGNNGGNPNDTLAQLSQLTQQLAAAQQYNGGGMPMNNNMMGGGNNNSYNSGMPNDPRQHSNGPGSSYGRYNNNPQGGHNHFGNNSSQGPNTMQNIPGVPGMSGIPGGPHQGGPPPGLGNNNNSGGSSGNAGLPFNVTPELAAMLLQQHQQQQQQRR